MGPSPQCCMPGFNVIGLTVLEKKIFEEFLLYMGMAAILVMWPGPCEQTFFPPTHECSTCNFTLIGPVVSEKEMFEECWPWTTEKCQYYKLTSEPLDQVS